MSFDEITTIIALSLIVGLAINGAVKIFFALLNRGTPPPRKGPIKIYLSGPITGIPNYKKAFNLYEEAVKIRFPDAEILNPVTFCADTPEGSSWDTYMDRRRVVLKEEATVIFMIPGWASSRGAREEHEIASCRGMRRIYSCDIGVNEEAGL